MTSSFLVIIAVILSTTISCTNTKSSTKTQSKLREINNEERIRHCDITAKSFGFDSLKFSSNNDEEIEIRVWVSGGLIRDRGAIIKFNDGTWSAYRLNSDKSDKKNVKSIAEPKIGFTEFMNKLEKAGVFVPPDSESNDEVIEDGQTVTIEVLKNKQYDTYSYLEPSSSDSLAAEKVIEILNFFEDNLGFILYARPKRS
jgi:hypothetical protein